MNETKIFYNSIASEFSSTRKSPWNGWSQVFQITKFEKPIDVLDLGCGNGRLLKYFIGSDFLSSFNISINSYLGLDNNLHFIEGCQNEFPYENFKFEQFDILTQKSDAKDSVPKYAQTQTFDLVCCFGVTHHIEGKNSYRLSWFDYSMSKVKANGYFVFSVWEFLNDSKNISKLTVEDKLSETDYLLGWNNREDIKRFCHNYNEEELKSIHSLFVKNGFVQILDLKSNPQSTNDKNNRYFVYHKLG